MADENKTENTDDITMDVMPGADPVPEDEAGKDFKVDLFDEIPHGLACLIMTVDGNLKSEKSISSPAKISL